MYKQIAITLVLCCAASTVQARLFHDDALSAAGRVLHQTNTRCPAGCSSEGCVLDSTSGGYKCTKCLGSLVVSNDDGTCGCPAGRYGTTDTCVDCDKGSYCEGGRYTGPDSPVKVSCTTDTSGDLTTIGKRTASKKSCVNVAGSRYSVDASGNPSSTTCPVNTYGPGLKKQRACAPCPPGYTTNALTGRTKVTACVVPEGYFLKGPGQVAPCPKGEYKSGFLAAASCAKCAAGVSTLTEASASESDCTVLLPTFYPANLDAGIIKATKKCPQTFYCPGGNPTKAFSPASPTDVADTTVVICPYQTWTEGIGASSADQCMTPPGHKTSTVDSTTTKCAAGSYRADWKPASAAASCVACGANIFTNEVDQLTVYDIDTLEVVNPETVAASAAACYIKPGQGMYFSPASKQYSAVNCSSNSYGVASTTYGLSAYPCRDCPAGLQTSVSLPNSAAYYFSEGDVAGFFNPMACVTKPGYGYNGRVATACPAGSYNAAGNYGTCTKCTPGFSTPANPEQQVSVDNCAVAQGYGRHDGAIVPCPVGTYNAELRSNTTAACNACPAGLTTSQAGGRSDADCNMCSVGYGGSDCATQCGGVSGATYGPAGRSRVAPDCVSCPAMSTGFSFDHMGNQNFTPAAVARLGADSAADCLAEFAQTVDSAWYLNGAVGLTKDASATTFDACVTACQGSDTCQFITYDYDTNECFIKAASPSSDGDVVAFKAVVTGDTTANSMKTTQAKDLASGSYTFWKETAGTTIGLSSTVGPTDSVQACLSACDVDAECAAVAMTGILAVDSQPGACSLIKGDTRVAAFKRSVTKTVVTRLEVSAAI